MDVIGLQCLFQLLGTLGQCRIAAGVVIAIDIIDTIRGLHCTELFKNNGQRFVARIFIYDVSAQDQKISLLL